MQKKVLIVVAICLSIFLIIGVFSVVRLSPSQTVLKVNSTLLSSQIPTPTVTPTPLPTQKILDNNYHIFQTFNNCGPAALSMALSYYGIHVTQQTLGQALRPYQNAAGDNDDKSVTLEELAEKSKEYGFTPYHRPNGSIEKIKLFIAEGFPVVTRTWLKENEDIGHYRVVKGFDDTKGMLIQDDSLQGKNLNYSYADFKALWKKFNYEYLVLVPEDKKHIAEEILQEEKDPKIAWEKAVKEAEEELQKNPTDIYTRFNLSIAYYNTGEYQKSIKEFEEVENRLSFRTLWYQIEPIEAYYHLGNYDKVFSITDRILNNQNRAFSELYILRGNIYRAQNNKPAAQIEFEKSLLYNKNSQKAKLALQSLNES